MKLNDVIIAYEGITREFDNSLLLLAELERRGYSVKLAYKSETIYFKKKRAIIVVPNCYNSANYEFYRYSFNANSCPIISLQYEQVLSKRIENIGIHNPKGKATNAYLFCWGKNCYDRLLNHGIKPEKMRICGAMQLDFLRTEFKDFYLDKAAIAGKFNLDVSKKWVLYISSFSYVDNCVITKYTADELNDYEFVKDFTELSVKSQKTTLAWFEQLINDEPNVCIIYRKHPVESENKRIKELTSKYPENFKDISDLSVKQWIAVSDIITTWFSTSIAEVYVARRPLLLIRPEPIKEEYDVPFYYNADSIDYYEKLKDAIRNEDEYEMPISKSVLDEYYSIEDTPAYIRIANEIDRVNKEFNVNEFTEEGFHRNRIAFLIQGNKLIKLWLKKIYQFAYIHMGYSIRNERIRKAYCISDWESSAKHYSSILNKEKIKCLRKIVNGK